MRIIPDTECHHINTEGFVNNLSKLLECVAVMESIKPNTERRHYSMRGHADSLAELVCTLLSESLSPRKRPPSGHLSSPLFVFNSDTIGSIDRIRFL